jgi:hypothetical protein
MKVMAFGKLSNSLCRSSKPPLSDNASVTAAAKLTSRP